MAGPLKKLRDIFSLQSAIDEGFNYKHKAPVISPERKKELMESAALTTPRSNFRAVVGVLEPYIKKSSVKEKLLVTTFLAGTLYLNHFSVDMMGAFGDWIGGLVNHVAHLWNVVVENRPDMIADMIGNYPALQDSLTADPMLNKLLLAYPDETAVFRDPQYQALLQELETLDMDSPRFKAIKEFQSVLQQRLPVEEWFKAFPGLQEGAGFKEKFSTGTENILNQLTGLKDTLGLQLQKLPEIIKTLQTMLMTSGGDFLYNVGNTLSTAFNSVAEKGTLFNADLKAALSKMWNSNDMATIALKFTGAAIAAYKMAQYVVLRWRSWTTGYYDGKYKTSKTFARIKNMFNNIDNPGQRIQEDPEKFTAASVSLLTGVTTAIFTLQKFSGKLWNMGPVQGVDGGFFMIGAAYAAVLLAVTGGVGYKLAEIYRNKQRVEANLRRATDNVHNNAEQIALTDSAEIEKDIVQKRVTPVMENAWREVGTQVKMTIVDSTVGNVSIPLPYLVASFAAVASGTASFGMVQSLNYAFNRVNSSLSFIVNRFDQISNWIATGSRMYTFDKAMDASLYIEEEKRQAGLNAVIPQQAPKMS